MGLPSVKPESWTVSDWAKAVAACPGRYANPVWAEKLGKALASGISVAKDIQEMWAAFRRDYSTAYEDAKRARNTEKRNSTNGDSTNGKGSNQQHERERSPYEVLGIRENATWFEIKGAYRSAMMNLHPDRVAHTGIDPRTATALAQEVNAAYVELENQPRKQAY